LLMGRWRTIGVKEATTEAKAQKIKNLSCEAPVFKVLRISMDLDIFRLVSLFLDRVGAQIEMGWPDCPSCFFLEKDAY
jgi:hypothetical protein